MFLQQPWPVLNVPPAAVACAVLSPRFLPAPTGRRTPGHIYDLHSLKVGIRGSWCDLGVCQGVFYLLYVLSGPLQSPGGVGEGWWVPGGCDGGLHQTPDITWLCGAGGAEPLSSQQNVDGPYSFPSADLLAK